ncbi:unnamed protein product [Rotaria socialis]|uniref:EB domain-containing protein n=1 Tax=Rotaria socialis TaxID=392032 RepID=A0A821B063_9BILA|nr:unnamed protein product [Rotaria socialis]CAF3264449.1 unnamed protein product [Rotaria socialis]CAF4205465.1 unnamed protein product [Rotaria socialis]CAF4286507.1 unnamed protein product [Rotaria socialis]CAF4432987.1 unnamed protein product [Rotaria socialis]
MWLILLIALIATSSVSGSPITTSPTTITTTTYIYDSVLGYPCDSDSNCGGLVGNSMCLNRICACRPGYVPLGIYRCV